MKYALGIDLGGTSIKGGLVNENGEIIEQKSIKTTENNEETLKSISKLISDLKDMEKIEGVGIGSPGSIDSVEGKVLTIGGNVSNWTGVEIKKEIQKDHPELEIKVENDANCAGLCEMWIGSGKGHDSAIAITLGTGLGGFLYWKNHIIRGDKYRASELGHTILYPNGRLCACGQNGCTERYVGGTGLEDTYKEITGKDITGEEIIENINTDENAKKTVEKFEDDLATTLVTFKNFFDPSIIIIGGGVINSADIWWDDMLKKYEEKINAIDEMPIVKAKFLNSSGIIGAASLILNKNE